MKLNKKSGAIALNWRKKLAPVRVVLFLRKRRLKIDRFCPQRFFDLSFGHNAGFFQIGAMTDSKYFATTKKGEIFELKAELTSDKKEKKKEAVKKVSN